MTKAAAVRLVPFPRAARTAAFQGGFHDEHKKIRRAAADSGGLPDDAGRLRQENNFFMAMPESVIPAAARTRENRRDSYTREKTAGAQIFLKEKAA